MLNKIAVTLLCPLLKTIFSPGFLDVWYVTPVKGKDQAPILTTTKKLIDDVHGPKEWQAESWKKTFWFVSQVQFLPSRFGLSDVRTGLKCVSLWFQTSTWYENSAAGVSISKSVSADSWFDYKLFKTCNFTRIPGFGLKNIQKLSKPCGFFRQNITQTSWQPGHGLLQYTTGPCARPRLVVHVPRQQMHQHLT